MSLFLKNLKAKYELSDPFHMTDCANLPSILGHGHLLSKNVLHGLKIIYCDHSNFSVQNARSNIIIPCTGKRLHDYVPLYWGKKTPMTAALQQHNNELIFLIFSLDLLLKFKCVISDGHARANRTRFIEFHSLDDLSILDCKSINTVKYSNNPETRRRKSAELLVEHKLSISYLSRIVCRSETVKNKIETILATHGYNTKVYIGHHNYYFL